MVAYALVVAIDDFPRGLLVLVCVLLAASGVWEGVLRRGWGRVAALSVAGVAGVGIGLLTADERFVRHLLLLGLGAVVWYVGARLAFRPAVAWPPAARPQRPVLFVNPRSGEGKAGRHRLDAEARDRGIEPVEMRPGDDLAELVRGRIDGGADAVAMAGGDGSQAVVAAAAAKAGLPYACIPSGTRNHFALDLGVDRDDVVGALDAFVDGGERLVDLGEVNGRVFVNNVSLGVYAEAVHRPGYRRAKMRTLLDTAPEVLGPAPGTTTLRWTTPGGRTMTGAAVILVGNNQYRLSGAAGAGTRPAVDQGQLGITVVDPPSTQGNRRRRPWRQWSATEFRVESDGPVPAGIDGEAVVLESPVCFRIAPSALRVRIATHHPGASPSSIEPVGALPALAALAGIAMGRDPRNLPTRPAPVGGAGIPAQRSGSVPDQVVEPGQDRPRRGAPSPPP
jgi:diacylglycerol kinase family enzyme